LFSKSPSIIEKNVLEKTVTGQNKTTAESIDRGCPVFFDKEPQPLLWSDSRAAVHILVGCGFDTHDTGDDGQSTYHIRIHIRWYKCLYTTTGQIKFTDL